MRPRCFSKAILYYGAPLPSAGSARAAFPSVISTIRALRLPAPTTGSLMIFASPLPLLASSFAPMRQRHPQGRVLLKPQHHLLYEVARTPDLSGSWRTHPIPLPCSRIPAGLHRPHLLGPRSAVPASTTTVTPAMSYIGTQSHGFDIRCLSFKLCVTAHACKARFRLVVSLCREGVEPSGFHRKVSVLYIGLPPLPGLS